MQTTYTMVLIISFNGRGQSVSYVQFPTKDLCLKAIDEALDWRSMRHCSRDAFMLEGVEGIQITPQVIADIN